LDAVLLTAGHNALRKLSPAELRKACGKTPVLVDVRNFFRRQDAEKGGFLYFRL